MTIHIRRWGNSDAVRIPAKTLAAVGLKTNDPVHVKEVDGRIVIEPATDRKRHLQELIDAITPENRHPVTDWGPPVGKEFR